MIAGSRSLYALHIGLRRYRHHQVPSTKSVGGSEIQACVDLLEQGLEHAHERDWETRRLPAAALELIPPQLEVPAESTDIPT
jgi:hypothetical protein